MIELQIPEHLSTSVLVEQAEREIRQFLRRCPTANACSYELFRRGFVLRDDQAWEGLYRLYGNLVSSWILHIVAEPQITTEDLISLRNAGFAKFARSISPRKFSNFSSVERLLVYFKLCVRCVVVDELRIQNRFDGEITIEAIEEEPLIDDPAEAVISKLVTEELWQIISHEIQGEDELIVVRENCIGGYQPHELQQRYPTMFASINDVYRIKRNIMDRLRRNRQLLAYRRVS